VTIADLAVNLGIKGSEKVGNSLTGVRKQMGQLTSTSLEAKAAIIGAMYALEKLTAQSGQMGTSLTQFTDLTGLSADKLQRWQYLALKSGESAQEMAGSIQAVQNAMTKMILGEGAPKGINALKNVVGFDINKARDTFYVMDKLREYAQKTKNVPDVANEIMKSFGLSEKTIQALRTSKVNLANVPRSQMYNGRETEALNKANIAWAELGSKLEHGYGRLNAKFGPQMVHDVSVLADSVLRLADAFGQLVQQTELLKGLDTFAKWVTTDTKFAVDLVKELTGKGDKKKAGMLPTLQQLDGWIADHVGGPTRAQAMKSIQNNVTTNVTVHGIADGEELAHKVSGAVKKHMGIQNNDAARQMPKPGF
jgi:hypothetical protein